MKHSITMAEKVVLYCFDGKGIIEAISCLLTVAGVEFEEVHVTTRDEFLKLLNDGVLMFQQLPVLQMDGMNLVHTKAILHYIADKYNLHGKDPKERLQINIFAEGISDLMQMIMMLPFAGDQKSKLANIETKAQECYMPVFEKALSGHSHLVGGKPTYADVLLLEATLMLEELFPLILTKFPNVKAFQGRMTKISSIDGFLKPGSKRFQPDENYVKRFTEVFGPF